MPGTLNTKKIAPCAAVPRNSRCSGTRKLMAENLLFIKPHLQANFSVWNIPCETRVTADLNIALVAIRRKKSRLRGLGI
jgi:hypothetical protein